MPERNHDHWLFGLFVLAVVAVSSIPYLWAFASRNAFTDTAAYTWIVPPYPEDGLGYLAWTKQAQNNGIFFKVKYTALPQRADIFNPYFLLAGQISRAAHCQPGFSLFILRIAATIGFLFIARWFAGLFCRSRRQVWLCLLLLGFSSGFGGLLSPFTAIGSADQWLVDINTLWSLSWNGLFACSLCLMPAILGLLQKSIDEDSSKSRNYFLAIAGALCGLLAFVHPYDVAVVLAAGLVLMFLFRHRSFSPSVLLFFIFALPSAIVQYLLTITNPVLHAHGADTMSRSPDPLSILLGLGFPLLFAVYGTIDALRRNDGKRYALPIIWIVISFLAAYSPVWFQRKLLFGIHVPLCILGALGLDSIVKKLTEKRASLALPLCAFALCLTVPTHVQVFEMFRKAIRKDPLAYYVPSRYTKAFAFLDAHSSPDDVVLADYATSRLLPGLAGNTVVFGHWAQSVDRKERMQWVGSLFSKATSPADVDGKKRRLLNSDIDYIFVDGPMRRDWFHGNTPGWLFTCASMAYSGDGIDLLRLKKQPRAANESLR